jgi:cobalt-zinc-cadmium resistance protein CzcA
MRIFILVTLALASFHGYSQERLFSIEEAIARALNNNARIKAAEFQVASQRQLRKTSFDLPKTDVSLMYGQYNSYVASDNNLSISQTIPFSALGAQASLNKALSVASEMKKAMTGNEVVYQVKQIYYELAFGRSRHRLLQQQDSIYEGFFKSASARYRTGETNLLEQTTAEAQKNEAKNQLRQSEATMLKLRLQLKILLNAQALPDITVLQLMPLSLEGQLDTIAYQSNPGLAYMQQQVDVAEREKKLQGARSAPDLTVGFFSQTLIGTPESENGTIASSGDRFTGFTIGISLPLWYTPHQARKRAADFNTRAAESTLSYYQSTLQGQLQQAIQQLQTHASSLEYYTVLALPNAELILKQSQASFREGEIGYAENLLNLRNAIAIKEGYLRTLNDYNQSVILIEFLSGNK